jgi:hypothetical protein
VWASFPALLYQRNFVAEFVLWIFFSDEGAIDLYMGKDEELAASGGRLAGRHNEGCRIKSLTYPIRGRLE